MNLQVAGQRPPAEVFDDFVEEINGILSSTLSEPAVSQVQNGEDPVNETIAENGDVPEETEVVIHTSPENNNENPVKRHPSIDSVDLMIEEEIKNITEDQSLDILEGSSKKSEQLEHPVPDKVDSP